MTVTLDCPKCEKLDAFEMIQWTDSKGEDQGWDINLQQCDCEITPEMERELNELADEESINRSYDPSMED